MLFTSLILCISNTLYSSAIFYLPNSPLNYVIKFQLGTQITILSLSAIVGCISLVSFLKYKTTYFSIDAIYYILLPWSIHILFSAIKNDGGNIILRVVISIILTIICLIVKVIFGQTSTYTQKQFCFINTKLIAMEIGRVWILNCLAIWLDDYSFIIAFSCINLIILREKIVNLSYLALMSEYCYLIMELWTWISLIIYILDLQDQENNFEILYFSLPLIILISLMPLTLSVFLLQTKIVWNLKKYQKEQSELFTILILYYFFKISNNKTSFLNSVVSKISKEGKVQIIGIFKQSLMKINKFQTEDIQQTIEISCFNELVNSNLVYMKKYVEYNKIFEKNAQKRMYRNNMILCHVLNDAKLLTIEYFYEIQKGYYSYKKSEKTTEHRYYDKIYRQIFYRVAKSSNLVCQQSIDQLIGLQEVETNFHKYLRNQKRFQKSKIGDNKQALMFRLLTLNRQSRAQIMKVFDLIENKSYQGLNFARIKYIFEKYLESSPFLARVNLQQAIKQEKDQRKAIKNNKHEAIFVCNLPEQGSIIKVCNYKFKKILQYHNNKTISVNDIIPEALKNHHDIVCRTKTFQISCHKQKKYYIQALHSHNIYETTLKFQYYLNYEQSLSIICSCKIQTSQKYQLENISKKKTECMLETNNQQIYPVSDKLGIRVKVTKGPQLNKIQQQNNKTDKNSFKQQQQIKFEHKQLPQYRTQKNKKQIDPLSSKISQSWQQIIIALIVTTIITIYAYFQYFIVMIQYANIIQTENTFIKTFIQTQVFLPTELSLLQLTLKEGTQLQIQHCMDRITKILVYLQGQINDLQLEIKGQFISADTAIQKIYFEQIDNIETEFHKKTYYSNILNNLVMNFQSLKYSINNDLQQKKQSMELFVRKSLALLHKVQQQGPFYMYNENFEQIKENAKKSHAIIFYAGLSCFGAIIILLFIVICNMLKSIQHFFEKSCLGQEFSAQFQDKFENMKKDVNALIKNGRITAQGYDSIDQQQSYPISNHKFTFYPYKTQFFVIIFITISTAICYLIISNPFTMPSYVTNLQIKQNSKVQLTNFVLETIHQLQQLIIQKIQSQGDWIQIIFETSTERQSKEIANIKIKSIHEILKNLTIDRPQINERVSQNPCQFWINCSVLEDINGQNILRWVQTKNQMITLLKQIGLYFENYQQFDYEKLNSVVKVCFTISYFLGQILSDDTSRLQVEYQMFIMNYSLYGLSVLVFFLVIILSRYYSYNFYQSYKNQILFLLPLTALRKNLYLKSQITKFNFKCNDTDRDF